MLKILVNSVMLYKTKEFEMKKLVFVFVIICSGLSW